MSCIQCVCFPSAFPIQRSAGTPVVRGRVHQRKCKNVMPDQPEVLPTLAYPNRKAHLRLRLNHVLCQGRLKPVKTPCGMLSTMAHRTRTRIEFLSLDNEMMSKLERTPDMPLTNRQSVLAPKSVRQSA